PSDLARRPAAAAGRPGGRGRGGRPVRAAAVVRRPAGRVDPPAGAVLRAALAAPGAGGARLPRRPVRDVPLPDVVLRAGGGARRPLPAGADAARRAAGLPAGLPRAGPAGPGTAV